MDCDRYGVEVEYGWPMKLAAESVACEWDIIGRNGITSGQRVSLEEVVGRTCVVYKGNGRPLAKSTLASSMPDGHPNHTTSAPSRDCQHMYLHKTS